MASRLDRLVLLLETGSTPFIRNTAADQLADLSKAHLDDSINLLSRVYPYLKSKKWETRVAAARAFGGIVNNIEVWDPNKIEIEESQLPDQFQIKKEVKEEAADELKDLLQTQDSAFISFDHWNLYDTLQYGQKLLASGGNEYNEFSIKLDDDVYKRQKTSINARLGFNGYNNGSNKDIDMKLEDDVKIKTEPIKEEPQQQLPPSVEEPVNEKQSARMRALARRKAKAEAKNPVMKQKTVDLSQSTVSRELVNRGVSNADLENESPTIDITEQANGEKLVVENKNDSSPLLSQHAKVSKWVWPFQGVYELLLIDLYNEEWERRHGATMGLRELVKKHAPAAGRVRGKSKEENDRRNSKTLEDLTVRILILLSLDRFGDYVSDTVIAPVRENAAQTLAALLIHLPEPIVLNTFKSLQKMVLHNPSDIGLKTPIWEVKHAGMSGLRYFVSVRTDILFKHTELLEDVISMVLHGLTESDDDVQSVAASTLIPIASEFVKLKLNLVFQVVGVIWDLLTNLRDDLSASIGSVMDLLAKLCSHREVLEKMKTDALNDSNLTFKNLVPRLFPFLRHSITDVRKSVLRTLLAFLEIDDDSVKDWIDGKVLRLIFQNILFEQNQEVLDLSIKVYDSLINEISQNKLLNRSMESLFQEHAQPLMTLLMTPIGISRHNYSMNIDLIMRPSGATFSGSKVPRRANSIQIQSLNSGSSSPSHTPSSVSPLLNTAILEPLEPGEDSKDAARRGRKRKTPPSTFATLADTSDDKTGGSGIPFEDHRINIDAPIFNGDITLVGQEVFIRTKTAAAVCYGKTIAKYSDDKLLEEVGALLKYYLQTPHSTPKLFSAIAIEEYAKAMNLSQKEISPFFKDSILNALNNSLVENDLSDFRELVPTLRNVRVQCLQLFNTFHEAGKISQHKLPQLAVVVRGDVQAGPDAFGIDVAEKIINEQYNKLMKSLSATYRLTASKLLEDASARVRLAIDDAVASKTERETAIMASYASAALQLGGLPKKLNYVIRSLMDSIKLENTELLQKRSSDAICNLAVELIKVGKKGPADKIVKNLCAFLCVDTSEVPEFGPNKTFKDIILSLKKEERSDPLDIAAFEKSSQEAKRKRRGAQLSLENFLLYYNGSLFDEIPKLKEIMLDSLDMLQKPSTDPIFEIDANGQAVVDALGILRALIPKLHPSLYDQFQEKLPTLAIGLKSELSVFRYSVARCLATACARLPVKTFPFLIKSVLPLLKNAGEVTERQGAIECIYHLSNDMGSDILPYVVFLIVPVLGRMSDSDKEVRTLATTTFASIIKLVPLEAGIPDPLGLPQDLLEGRDREREFIQQMMDPSKVKSFELPVAIKATLRKYQQEGVNWLAFLNKYHLHGILCDDMGLGKTLQTICIVASDQFIRAQNFLKSQEAEFRPLPSLIVCPPSLTGHWEQEVNTYAPGLTVIVYAGGPSVRAPLRAGLKNYDVIVTSYDVIRNDIEILEHIDYNYCVLDEGHIIKNASTKLSKSVKRLRAEHRLILSGTPIQNNVLELWSLFDFLMPGFLGSEKHFQEKFAKPIAASRNSKTSSKEQEAGALALEALHKQTLPFMLRRLKEDVLSDLPPKIIQDYYCELSDLQKQLYNDFAKKQKSIVAEDIEDVTEDSNKQHIFQALQYMRKLCNHPALVVTPSHPQYLQVLKYLKDSNMDLKDIRHAPKLQSLRTLLLECGIGTTDPLNGSSKLKSNVLVNPLDLVISQHRALVFCQLKDMLDMVENDLFKKYMPSVTYMRLDGSTDPRDRQSIVRKFNEDPSIDVLLLTTKVGGLGLNLTGADTVIFVEHDWNPMNDLQAMDRAHRLGQKKVVNVYRLITKNTLEEKIMGLQKFKMNIASTIINQQNGGLSSMDTNQLLDLFEVDEDAMKLKEKEQGEKPEEMDETGLGGKAGAAVGELGELWDKNEYEEEYDLNKFIKSLK